MGNIESYCGGQCMSKDEIMQKSERIFPRPQKVLNDQQEYCLRKVANAWKNYKNEKSNPFSSLKLKKLLKILDERIQNEKGEFVSQKDFESKMHPEVCILSQKLAQAERTRGFKSLQDPKSPRDVGFNDHTSSSSLNKLDFDNILVLRKPVLMRDSGDLYFGFWNLKGETQGYAKIIRDGMLFEGDWTSAGNCSNGRLYYTNGTYFEGNISHFLPNGKGTLSNNDDCFYIGDWVNGEYNGTGILSISRVCRYEGELKMSALQGKGKLIYESDEGKSYNYDGEFENNKFNGSGKLQYFENEGQTPAEYTGNWKNGLPSGRGHYRWPSGNNYEGNYEDGKKNGQGKYTYNSGKSYYEGSWSNGKPNRKGILVIEDVRGQIKISGMWNHGNPQKIDSEEELKKINGDESKLIIPVDLEIFSNGFNLNLNYATPKKTEVTKLFNNFENGKLHYELVKAKGPRRGNSNSQEKREVFSNKLSF